LLLFAQRGRLLLLGRPARQALKAQPGHREQPARKVLPAPKDRLVHKVPMVRRASVATTDCLE